MLWPRWTPSINRTWGQTAGCLLSLPSVASLICTERAVHRVRVVHLTDCAPLHCCMRTDNRAVCAEWHEPPSVSSHSVSRAARWLPVALYYLTDRIPVPATRSRCHKSELSSCFESEDTLGANILVLAAVANLHFVVAGVPENA